MNEPNYNLVTLEKLQPFGMRRLRPGVLERLRERITGGYNPARPLSVIRQNGHFLVADGNHRLQVLKELGVENAPCVIYESSDPYQLAVSCNKDEDTYAPMDLFDWLDIIGQRKAQGLTQEQIGQSIGWSEVQVKQYSRLLGNVVTEVREVARQHQAEDVTTGVTSVTFAFTEGWFRNSGIYDLEPEYQMRFMRWFLEEQKANVANKKLVEYAAQLREIQEQTKIVEAQLQDEEAKPGLLAAVNRGEYTTRRLQEVIARLNEKAKNRALFGVDALEFLQKLPDASVDCVVTDPPWGVDFVPSRPTQNPNFDGALEETLTYLDATFAELKRVAKDNAHLYVFFPTAHYPEFRALLEKHFTVHPIPLAWIKNNHNPADFKQRYASQYETIFFCKAASGHGRKLNNPVSPDVLVYPKSTEKHHDCQKPVPLLRYLIENSTGRGEMVIDPFAGSGSALLAAAECGRYFIGFEKDTAYEATFRRLLGEIKA